ncbi:hypothetical protein ACHAXH_002553 [Discostella pseudostelligera]
MQHVMMCTATTSASNKNILVASIKRWRSKVRLVIFLKLFLLKALCSLVALNFYMATQISTVHEQSENGWLSMMKMMDLKGGHVDKVVHNNTQDSNNSNEQRRVNTKILNQSTNNIENDRMITPTSQDGTLQGKERLWAILQTRNITQVNANYWASVPSWDTILRNIHRSKLIEEEKNPIIGGGDTTTPTLPSPIIHGLETCSTFQQQTSTNPSQRRLAPAGLFNTGTNYLSVLLEYNCQNPHRVLKFNGNAKRGHGNEWEVPWGKHTPASFRHNYTKSKIKKYEIEEVLPIVLIRNPYSWMKSMCRNPYTARWKGMHDSKNCPQLKYTMDGMSGGNINEEYNAVDVNYGSGPSHHKSLGHLWNDWYGEYLYSNTTNGSGSTTTTNAPFPRLIVRFEDIIFFPYEVTKQICTCAGGILGHRQDDKDVANGTFHYVVRSAKAGMGHGPASRRNGLIDSWVRYGRDDPKDEYSELEIQVAKEVLDPWIMGTFEYG